MFPVRSLLLVAAAALPFLTWLSVPTRSAERRTPLVAVARLEPAEGFHVFGAITLLEVEEGVRVLGDVGGLTPGLHGLHVHEKADLSAPDFSSAGGHFNPANYPHAGRASPIRHLGDLGNIMADGDGFAHIDFVDTQIALSGANSVVGLPLVVHARADDNKTQPTGNAGPAVAAGVITLRK